MSVFGSPTHACNTTLHGSRFSSHQFPVVYAVGDIHGDYEAFRACMLMTGCVEEVEQRLVWKAGATRVAVVVLGDVVDRWRRRGVAERVFMTEGGGLRSVGEVPDEESSILAAMNLLASQAEAVQSALFRLIGNHELMQMEKDEQHYAQAEFATPFAMGIVANDSHEDRERKREVRQRDFIDGTMHDLVADCRVKAVVQIGGTVFVHGGINAGVLDYAQGRDLLELCNATLTERLAKGTVTPACKVLLTNAGRKRGGNSAFPGILWDDDLSDGSKSSTYAREVLNKLNRNAPRGAVKADRIAVAHCQQSLTPITTTCEVGSVPAHVSRNDLYVRQSTLGPTPRFVAPRLKLDPGANCSLKPT